MKHKAYCQDCGSLIPKHPMQSWNMYQRRKYCSRVCQLKHCSIGLLMKGKRGSETPNWKGGTTIMDGYRYLRMPGHHLATIGNGNYAAEHRVVMEQKLGRRLLPGEVVHHKDRDTLNNHPDNLEVYESPGAHTRANHLEDTAPKSRRVWHKECAWCHRVFVVTWENKRRVTCSERCRHRYQGSTLVGKPSTSSTKFKKGQTPWNKKDS